MFDLVVFSVIYFMLGQLVILLYRNCLAAGGSPPRRKFQVALAFRGVMTFGYYWYTLGQPSDAYKYFQYARDVGFHPEGLSQPGTAFVSNFTALLRPLVGIFSNEYLMLYIPFSLAAFLGSLLMYEVLGRYLVGKRKRKMLLFLSFYLPNLVFWTSNLGKDSLAFAGICLIMHAAMMGKKVQTMLVQLLIGGATLYFVRPHVLFFLLASFSFGHLFRRQRPTATSVVAFGLALLAFIVLFDNVMNFVGIRVETEAELGSQSNVVSEYYEAGIQMIEQGSNRLSYGGAATGPREANPFMAPLYLVQFIGGPFLWQARSGIQLISAMENIIYQLMLAFLLFKWRVVVRMPGPQYKSSWILFTIIAGSLMGMMYSNFGLTVRQKCMVLPPLILLYAVTSVAADRKSAYRKHAASARSSLPARTMPHPVGMNNR